jgi:hypothetical protein
MAGTVLIVVLIVTSDTSDAIFQNTELGMRPHYVSKEVNKMPRTNVTFLLPNFELHYSNVDHLSWIFTVLPIRKKWVENHASANRLKTVESETATMS